MNDKYEINKLIKKKNQTYKLIDKDNRIFLISVLDVAFLFFTNLRDSVSIYVIFCQFQFGIN